MVSTLLAGRAMPGFEKRRRQWKIGEETDGEWETSDRSTVLGKFVLSASANSIPKTLEVHRECLWADKEGGRRQIPRKPSFQLESSIFRNQK